MTNIIYVVYFNSYGSKSAVFASHSKEMAGTLVERLNSVDKTSEHVMYEVDEIPMVGEALTDNGSGEE